ncbi:MAG: hypothetical protein U0521_24970 [Anaerolineae bacterium]
MVMQRPPPMPAMVSSARRAERVSGDHGVDARVGIARVAILLGGEVS